MMEQATIHKKNTHHVCDILEEFNELIAMIGCAWAPQSTSIMKIMRYHEIHQNNIIESSTSSLTPTDQIQCNTTINQYIKAIYDEDFG